MNADTPSAQPLLELALTPPKTRWHGKWLWAADAGAARNAYAHFRRTFQTTGGRLAIEISADSFYWLYLDGEFVCRGPARAHLDYYSFDTHCLNVAAGRHCLAILAHHIGEINATVMTGRPGLLAEVTLSETDREQDLSTGPDWRCLAATAWRRDLPCLMSHFGFWEECDLRLLPHGWTTPGFADDAWGVPLVVGTPPCPPWPRLCPRDIPLPRYAEIPVAAWTSAGTWRQTATADAILAKTVASRRRTPAADGTATALRFQLPDTAAGHYLVADFGRTVSGFVHADIAESEPGQCLEFSYDDLLGPDATVYPERSYAHLTDRFVLPGGPCRIRTAHPRGFRYLMVDLSGAGALGLAEIVAVEETYPFELRGSFLSPEPALNRFHLKAAETVRICTTDAFTDCATRERVQWMEDLYVHSLVAAYTFGDTRLLRRALFQGAQNALPDGRINGFMPAERTNCAFAGSSIVWLHLLVHYWLLDGSTDLTRLLPAARRVLDCCARLRDADGLIASWPAGQFWDWAPIESAGCLLVTNAAYAWALERLGGHAVFRDALGTDLGARAAAIRTAAHARFWDDRRQLYRNAVPEGGLTPIYSQQANAMAMLAGLCQPAERPALLRRILDPANLGPVPVGEDSLDKGPRPSPERIVPVGTLWFGQFLCQALFEAQLNTEALQLMRELWGAYDTLPTFPETRIQHGNTFLCHGWAGGPGFLLPMYVLGLRPGDAGWSEVLVEPHVGDLPEASGAVPTPRGVIRASWKREDRAVALRIEAPAGMRVRLRDGEAWREWMGGKPYTGSLRSVS